MKSGGGRTLGTGKEGIGVAQKLVGSEVPRRVLYRVEEAVVLLGLSRSQLYELIRSGRLQTVTEGRVRLIPAAAIDAYVSLLTVEARAAGGDDAAQPGRGWPALGRVSAALVRDGLCRIRPQWEAPQAQGQRPDQD
jgi:excisionase family DNA binding protein